MERTLSTKTLDIEKKFAELNDQINGKNMIDNRLC